MVWLRRLGLVLVALWIAFSVAWIFFWTGVVFGRGLDMAVYSALSAAAGAFGGFWGRQLLESWE